MTHPSFRAAASILRRLAQFVNRLAVAPILLATSCAAFASGPTFTIANNVFPATAVGQSTTQNVTLTVNTAVPITSISLGLNVTEYTLGTITGCTIDPSGKTIVPASSVCTIPVTFKPVAPGKATALPPVGRSAPLLVGDIEGGKAAGYSFALAGTGTGPSLSFSPGYITGFVGDPKFDGGFVQPGCATQTDNIGDGCPSTEARPFISSMALDPAGNLYISDGPVYAIHKVDAVTGIITVIAGTVHTQTPYGGYGNNGPATGAEFYNPGAIALDQAGNIYIYDNGNNWVQEINAATGIISTVAGGGNYAPGTGHTALQTALPDLGSILVDPSGNIYLASYTKASVYRVDAQTQTVTIFAGTGTPKYPGTGDGGPASSAALGTVIALAMDSAGNLYIADEGNNVIRRVDAVSGNISTPIGTAFTGSGQPSCANDSGDGGAASQAFLGQPGALAFDAADNLYIAEGGGILGQEESCPIRRVDAVGGLIHTVAGNKNGNFPDQNDTSAFNTFLSPNVLTVDGDSNLYVGMQQLGPAVRKVVSANSAVVFPQQSQDVTAGPQLVLATNAGIASTLTFSNLPFAIAPNPSYFFSTPYAGSDPQDCAVGSLAPDAVCGIGISFYPTSNGSFMATDTVEDNSLNTATTHTIAISGSAYNNQTITLTPDPLAFGDENVGSTTKMTLTYNNLFTSATFMSASISGGGAAAFSLPAGSTCTSTIAAGGSCTFPVAFNPLLAQPYSATLTAVFLDQHGIDQTLVVPLTGTGQTPSAPAVTLTPSSIAFPGTPVATTSAAISTELTNTGTAPLTNIAATITGANPSDFAISANTCGATLAAGDTCTISVTFKPSAAQTYSASISIADNAANTPQKVPLSGTGYTPPTFTIANNVFSIPVGQTQTQNVTLTVNAAVPITSIGVLADFPEYTLGTVTGCTVDSTGKTVEPVGTVCTIPITFKPVAPGKAGAAAPVARSAPLLVTDIESSNPVGYTFPLEGTATGPLASFYPGTVSVVAPASGAGCTQETDQEGDGCPISDVALQLSETAVDSAGNIFVLEQGAYDVRRIDAKTSIVTTVAGQWRQQESEGTGDGGPATKAGFYIPRAIAVDSEDNVYVADYLLLRKINAATGIITSIAGDGTQSASKGGPAAKAAIPTPITAITVDPAGDVFFSTEDGTIYRVDGISGLISFVVGNQTGPTYPATGIPGPASAAQIGNPLSLGLDSAGNLYIADQQSGVVYQVSESTGVISVYAGTPIKPGSRNNGCSSDSGEGGAADAAFISSPFAISLDPGDNLYIAAGQSGACPILRVDAATGLIHTVAGNTTGGPIRYTATDTSAFDTDFSELEALSVDPFGNLLVANQGILYQIASGTPSIFFPTEDYGSTGTISDETNFVTLTNAGVTTALAFTNEPFPTSGPPYTTYPLMGSTPQDCSTAGPLAPGASCGIGVSFNPTANGTFNGTVTVQDNSLNVPAAPQTISLLGTLENYNKLTIAPNPLTFGSESVGTPTTLNIVITDTNTISSNPTATFELGDTTSFSAGTIVCTAQAGGGSTCTVPVIFTPQAQGPLSCTLLLQFHDARGVESEDVTVSGTGTPAAASAASLAPSTLAFPDTTVGQTATALTATLSNTGTAPVNNIAITIAGANPADFATTNATTCGTTLAAGAQCTISVTFTPASATSFSATLTVTDSDASSPQTATLTGTGIAAPAVTGPFDLVFSPAPVPNGIPQTLTATFQITNYTTLLSPTISTHYGNSYVLGAFSCTGSVGAQTCSVPVTFTPDYPGGRKDALFLMNGTTRLATVLLYGVGESPFALVQPASVLNTYNSTGGGNNSYFYQSVTDENGTIWSVGDNVSTLTSLTKAGVLSIIPITGLTGPTALGIDGAGVLYIAYGGNKSNLITYDTVQGTQGLYNVPGATDLGTVAVGNTGNIYAIDTNNDILYTIAPGGTPIATTLVNGSTNQADTPIAATVDSSENLFFGGYWTTNEYSSTGVQSTINTTSSKYGIAVDPADTVYAGIYGAGIEQLPASDYSKALHTFNDTTFPFGVSLGPDGTVNVGNYFSVNEYIRTQGTLTFSTDYFGTTTAPAQTAGIYNGGNENLTISNIALTGAAFTEQPSTTNPCSNNLVLAPGAACQVDVTFTSPHPGSFTGSLTFTSNTLNGTNATTAVALTGTMEGDYGVPSPAALTFAPQVVNTTSAAQTVTVTNDGYGQAMGLDLPNNIPDFTVSAGTCTGSIAVGASCQLSVTFTPAAAQAYNDTVTVGTTIGGGASGPSFTFTVAGTGIPAAAPAVTLSPNPIAFGNQTVQTTSAAQTVILTNTGNATLSNIAITLAGANPSDFAISANTCVTTLAAGANCAISITFTPASATTFNASLSVADNAAGSPQAVALSGTGTPAPTPQAVLTPGTLSFPSTNVGSTSAVLTSTLSNPGNATLNISGITLGGVNPSDFSISSNTCGKTLAASATCVISVTFSPASATTFNASISVADDAANTPQTVMLSGTGTPAPASQAVLTPSSLSFPSTNVGSTSAVLTTTLSNPGNATLNISGITLVGANPTDFNISSNTCGSTLAASATCVISVTFSPASATTFNSSISVADNAANTPQIVMLSGTGTPAPAPQAVLTPSSLSFPSTNVGSTSAVLTTTLSNPGNATLTISGIALAGANPTDFNISSNTCGSTLAASANCVISVAFNPVSATSFNAFLSVADNATNSPQTVSLSGTGTPAPAKDFSLTAVTPTGSVQSGATASFTFNTAGINGDWNAPITFTAAGLPSGATFTFTPTAVTPGGGMASSVLAIQTPSLLWAKAADSGFRKPWLAILLLVPLFGVTPARRMRRSRLLPILLLALSLAPILALAGCAGGYYQHSPQAYTITVTGTSGSTAHSTSVTLTVE